MNLLSYFADRQAYIIDQIRTLVEQESPSGDPARITIIAQYLVEQLNKLGATVKILPTTQGPAIHAHLPGSQPTEPSLLIVGHYDTVWPVGTLARKPFEIVAERITGPGVFDMKAGLALLLAALTGLQELGHTLTRSVDIFLSCDEEQGSHTTRTFIEDLARSAVAALVLEPCLPGGRVKTARKGIGQFHLTTKGRAAHAGVAPEKGVSALEEMAHQIIQLHALTDHSRGISVNVGTVIGGTMSNVVAAQAEANIDVRFWKATDQEYLLQALQALKPVLPGAEIQLTGKINRPPLETSPAIEKLYEHARKLSQELGFDLGQGRTGGGSDGNFIAALGIPVLDGLGPDGDGAHAENEHVLVANLIPRTALIARLIETI